MILKTKDNTPNIILENAISIDIYKYSYECKFRQNNPSGLKHK